MCVRPQLRLKEAAPAAAEPVDYGLDDEEEPASQAAAATAGSLRPVEGAESDDDEDAAK